MQQAVAQLGDTAADIADADDADGLALDLVADQRVAVDIGLAAQRAVGLEDALGQRQHHPERMLGDRIGVAAGLIDDEHAAAVQASTSTGSKPAPFEDTIRRFGARFSKS